MVLNSRLLAVAVFATVASFCLSAAAGPYTGLYVLGDSLSDQGNLYIATSDLGPKQSPPRPAVPDPARYFNGRFSDGEVYAGYLAQMLDVSIGPSLLGGTNFAFGGARTDYNRVEARPIGQEVYPHGAYPWSLNGERKAFAARG